MIKVQGCKVGARGNLLYLGRVRSDTDYQAKGGQWGDGQK